MLKTETSGNRGSLGFPEVVRSAFNFLVEDYSFRCVKSDVTFVRFESSCIFVNVYHGRVSFELNVEIGELKTGEGNPEVPFTIGEILHSLNAPAAVNYHPYQVHTPDSVRKFVYELARLTKQYAVPALIGEHGFFLQVAKVQTQMAEQYLKGMTLNRTRTEVDTAWHTKDYARVIELYNSMLEDLTGAEAKKLEYAKKKCFS